MADPAWLFGDRLPGKGRGAEKHYRCMPTADIAAMRDRGEVPELESSALLLLWRVAAMPWDALDVVKAWGFTPKSEIVWVKTTKTGAPAFGMGHYVRGSHETCIVATRGRFKVKSRSVRSVFFAPREAHSKKPDAFYELVETLADGPYAEMFARRSRPGWSCWGNELPGGHVTTPRDAA